MEVHPAHQPVRPSAPQIGAVIVCRFDSQRLPGKVLREVEGRPLLWYVVSRCRAASELQGSIAVATSERAIDDPIADYCASEGLVCHRGPADDVARRVLSCAQSCGFDWFARVNGDSPFVDLELLRAARRLASCGDLDLVTNLAPRSFPYGVSVELIRTEAFAVACRQMSRPEHFEHVTKFLYEHLHEYRYANLRRRGVDLSRVRLTVDTEEDLQTFTRLVRTRMKSWERMTYLDAAASL